MAKIFIEESTLSAIGDAIRAKTGKTDMIPPLNMPTEIASIQAGGGSSNVTTSDEHDPNNKSSLASPGALHGKP